jgi:mannose-6-phosphate isomerase-like protein (cupin superfamily)
VIDDFSAKILKELLDGAERKLPARPAPKPEQQKAAEHWTRPILMERGAYLSKLARYGEGSASETIKEYPQHCVMLSVRSRNGDAEVHENFAHIFLVLDGNATLVSGGTLAGPGEIRDGVRYQLRAGDVAHVPAGTPHQLLVAADRPATYLVFKVQENPEPAGRDRP